MKKKKKDEKRKRSVISMTDELRQKWEEELSRKRDSYNNKPKVEERIVIVNSDLPADMLERVKKETLAVTVSCNTHREMYV